MIWRELKEFLLILFNRIKESGKIPLFMRTANISAIYKVNSIIHDVLSNKSNDPIDIMVLDYKQMFNSECLFECLNDVFEAGVDDDKFALLHEANRENVVAVKTPNGITGEKYIQTLSCRAMFLPLSSQVFK